MVGQTVYSTEITTGIDEQAQLPFWQVSDQGMSLRLVQRLPIQSRAFFMARGFTKGQAERIAQSCIFQTVFKNTSDKHQVSSPLNYDLNDWQVMLNNKKQSMKMREQWDVEWVKEKVNKPQRLAFEWALYPTVQSYKPGDYNWGMSSFNLKPGTQFDLKIVWNQFNKQQSAIIKDIHCAEDINPQPKDNF